VTVPSSVPQSTFRSGLHGTVALVTGAAGGIGRAASLELARQGAVLVLVDRDLAGGQSVAAEVAAVGREPLFFAADVSQASEIRAYVQAAIAAHGRIDTFFNNAGIEGVASPVSEYPEEVLDQVLSINVRGLFLGLKHVLDVMVRQKHGCVINTASVAALRASPLFAPYSMSKHAALGLTRSAAVEVAKYGVRVNAVCPGPIDTRMMRSIDTMSTPANPNDSRRAAEGRNPMGRYGTAEEVANVVCFLASDAASYITGAAWTVDGGRTAI
jgi:NAD(P)-dependent dehydrogenase (short-subunit alcohol dehydrogenase family)